MIDQANGAHRLPARMMVPDKFFKLTNLIRLLNLPCAMSEILTLDFYLRSLWEVSKKSVKKNSKRLVRCCEMLGGVCRWGAQIYVANKAAVSCPGDADRPLRANAHKTPGKTLADRSLGHYIIIIRKSSIEKQRQRSRKAGSEMW